MLTGSEAIILNQENFLLKNNGYLARNALPGHHLILKPAIKNGFDGRPKNGMFIAIPISLKDAVKEIPVVSDRLQCATVDIDESKILLINSYFPTDPRADFDEQELLAIFAEITKIVDENSFNHFVLGGDLNADFSRRTKFVTLLREFLDQLNVQKSWELFKADFSHTTENNGKTYTSLIDHFIWDTGFTNWVEDAGVLHLPENMSDHEPIYCKLKVQTALINPVVQDEKARRYIPSWRTATDIQKKAFSQLLDERLSQVEVPYHCLDCRDVHCNSANHIRELDVFMSDVLGTIEECAEQKLSKKQACPKKKKNLPEWKEDVDPAKETAYFWNAVWKSAGKPLNCHLHWIMKRTRNAYHLVIRKKKRLLERLKRDKMLTSCLNGDGDIFKEIRKQRRCKQAYPTTIDGRSNDIPNYLACKYETLYNQVDDKANLEMLESKINENITDESLDFVNRITASAVRDAVVKKLKAAKTDPVADISSDYLINAPAKLFEIIALCFQSYIIHAHVSNFLLISTLVPLLKDKLGDTGSSDNYRSIAISSLILKIFDLVIISEFKEFLELDDLQFAYQSGVSTSMCTWLAVETISHFLRNGSEVYTCLMDMSKAFDTVQHSHLFQKLLDQGMPMIIVRYILISYKYQRANVSWDGEQSRFFSIGNGVKQGAILSAILYCVYTNGLFQKLRQQKIGCFVEESFVGVLGYADDIYLMSPTLDGLQSMLYICEEYADKHNLRFSTHPNPNKSKTKCMAYLKKERELPRVELCGNKLPWVDNGKHLGMKIEATIDNLLKKDIVEKRARYIQCNNELMQEFAYTSCSTKAFINRVFNSHAYGSVLWDLYGREVNMLYNSWSTSIRKMFRLDRQTHRYLIEPISDMEHLRSMIQKRFLSFIEKLDTSPKIAVKKMYRKIGKDCRSTTGANCRRIRLECSSEPSQGSRKRFAEPPFGQEWRIPLIKELIAIRDGSISINWTREEVEETLTHLCTT